jgi:hypothetical protein
MNERRRHPRVAVEQVVSLTCPTCDVPTSAVVLNVSLEGAYLRTSSCVGDDAEITVVLRLPVDITRTREVRILCHGIVIRRNVEGRKAGIGIEFHHYEPLSEFEEEAA